jgi:hypothetical protein
MTLNTAPDHFMRLISNPTKSFQMFTNKDVMHYAIKETSRFSVRNILMVYLTTLSADRTTWRRVTGWLMSDLERTWKEAVIFLTWGTIPKFVWSEEGQTTKASVRLARRWAEISFHSSTTLKEKWL